MPLRLIPDTPKIPFMKFHKLWIALSLITSIVLIAGIATRGLNMGIDFTGGIVMELRTESPIELSTLRQAAETSATGVSLQHFGSDNDILLRVQATEDQDQGAVVKSIREALTAATPTPIEFRRIDYVGPQVGSELVQGSILAVLFSMLAIQAYVWFRFEWQFGVGVIIALLHDTILTLGFFFVTGIEFNLTSVAAILTIIGYSVNDSVVIYDRVRENLRKYKKMPLPEIINRSTNETLSRTILTGGTTLTAILALILVGGGVIRDFSWVLFFGIVIGTYSSIFISAPVLLYTGLRREPEKAAATA